MWLYFEKQSSDNAKCTKCGDVLSCKGSSTSGLTRHLQKKHSITLPSKQKQVAAADDSESAPSSTKKQKKSEAEGASSSSSTASQQQILKFAKRQSLAEIVSRLVALDGFTVHGVTNSAFIKESLKARGYTLPNHNTSVMNLVHTFYETAREQTKAEIEKLKEVKFSATLDEWTSLKNRRYLNVNLHSIDGKFFNLGLIRIKKSCPAETVKELMLEKLREFGLAFSDIIAATTDGAAVMVKFGGLICETCLHQECFNHGVHLAAVDVIFKKCYNSDLNDDAVSVNTHSGDDEDSGSDDDYDDDSNNGVDSEANRYEIRADINDILQMVRKIVKTFKNSPVKNSVLQKYIKEKHGKELSLLFDCRTRWNSTEEMIERFVLVFDSIVLALNDLNLSELIIDDADMNVLRNLLKCLQPIKLASQQLGRRDANLLTAEATISFLFDSLEQRTDYISVALYEAMKKRIHQRRNKDLVSAIKFLQNKDFENERYVFACLLLVVCALDLKDIVTALVDMKCFFLYYLFIQ